MRAFIVRYTWYFFQLEKDDDLDLKRFEVDKNVVHFYFDEV